ncbi:unnamed protein product [Larinioides sclopetarius]|uniref:Uncharacterized protein n=1 Tax=Larinioides sclopetarius TaxID=280406 RepID=A0AAV2ACU5_9ARAC
MEKQLRYSSMLTLEEIALRRLAAVVWCESDVLALTAKYETLHYLFNEEDKTWKNTVVDVVKDKMSKLQLPDSITEQMTRISELIGTHILNWKILHESILKESSSGMNEHILEKLCFTTAGSVDYRQTAEALVRSDVLDIVSRYKLSCLYCLEDYIPDLFSELPDEKKKYFYDEIVTISSVDTFLWFLWPYILKGEEFKLDRLSRSSGNQSNFRQYAFEYAAIRGNRAAVEYFFRKLLPEERESPIIRAAKWIVENADRYEQADNYPETFPVENISGVLCYLLSLMTNEQQIQIFKEKPHEFLGFFLQWPFQDIFLDNVDVVWTHFPESDFYTFFWNMIIMIKASDFADLSRDFSLRMTSSFIKYFVYNKTGICPLFLKFLSIRDTENVKFILRNIDAADRVELLSSFPFFQFYLNSNDEDIFPIVEMCLREAMLSVEDKRRIKKALKKFERLFEYEDETQHLRKFLELLYETDATAQS